jgi:hypothetical protein
MVRPETFPRMLFSYVATLVPYWRVCDDAWSLADGSHLLGIVVQRNYGGETIVVIWDPTDPTLVNKLTHGIRDQIARDPTRCVVVLDDRNGELAEDVRQRIAPVDVVTWSERIRLGQYVIKDTAGSSAMRRERNAREDI